MKANTSETVTTPQGACLPCLLPEDPKILMDYLRACAFQHLKKKLYCLTTVFNIVKLIVVL